jgi:thioredoxin 2
MDVVQELTASDFADTVRSLGVAVLYFWGTYCGPCHAMAPQFERAATLRPSYLFAKQNINEHRRPSFELGIHTIPTVAVFRAGRLLGTRSGVLDAEQLVAVCDELAAGTTSSQAA